MYVHFVCNLDSQQTPSLNFRRKLFLNRPTECPVLQIYIIPELFNSLFGSDKNYNPSHIPGDCFYYTTDDFLDTKEYQYSTYVYII